LGQAVIQEELNKREPLLQAVQLVEPGPLQDKHEESQNKQFEVVPDVAVEDGYCPVWQRATQVFVEEFKFAPRGQVRQVLLAAAVQVRQLWSQAAHALVMLFKKVPVGQDATQAELTR
jgi:hypothetical protein